MERYGWTYRDRDLKGQRSREKRMEMKMETEMETEMEKEIEMEPETDMKLETRHIISPAS